ncbi:hypothetical protein [Yinghuangia soli]|uniref:Uncharacterized protein n=1 Tax=Yinghuangia soli TaxID=2908204 RepID=A0AA41TYE8_9ACTN|nr:hypothetical protein [Yinghuangia soli]MCF2526321.1 hypothetical protein [Yinghuangia soli]
MNQYWGHQRRTPPAANYGPPQYMPGPVQGGPPHGGDRNGDRNGKLMLILTLVGTVATVVSVLVALGIGPFDLSSGKDDSPQAVPAANDAAKKDVRVLKDYVADVNKLCSDRQGEITQKLDAFDQAITVYNTDPEDPAAVTEVQRSLRSVSLTYSSLVKQINAVPRLDGKGQDAQDAEEWRSSYESQVKLIEQASMELDAGDPAFADTIGRATDGSEESDRLQQVSDKIGVVCD